jgi:hypothetical protein
MDHSEAEYASLFSEYTTIVLVLLLTGRRDLTPVQVAAIRRVLSIRGMADILRYMERLGND